MGPARDEIPSVAAQQATAQLSSLLLRNQSVALSVDAGNFGKVLLRIERPAPIHQRGAAKSADRTRWLATAVLALLRRQVATSLVDEETRRRLRYAVGLPGGAFLAGLAAAPAALMPHLRWLSLDIESKQPLISENSSSLPQTQSADGATSDA